MKGKFDACILWPLAKRVPNWIVGQSTVGDFIVIQNWESLQNIGSAKDDIISKCPLSVIVMTNIPTLEQQI